MVVASTKITNIDVKIAAGDICIAGIININIKVSISNIWVALTLINV